MKAIFLDIDGVLQPKNSQVRFEHIKEVPSLAKELTTKLDNGFDYYEALDDRDLRIGLEKHFVLSKDGYIHDKEAEAMLQALSLADGPYSLPQEFKDEEFIAWREKWILNSNYYY